MGSGVGEVFGALHFFEVVFFEDFLAVQAFDELGSFVLRDDLKTVVGARSGGHGTVVGQCIVLAELSEEDGWFVKRGSAGE